MNKYLLFLALVAAMGVYWNRTPTTPLPTAEPPLEEEESLPTEPILEPEQPQPTTQVERPQKKTSPKKPVSKKTRSLQLSQGPKDPHNAKFNEKGELIIEQIVIAGRHLTVQGDLLVGDIKDLPRIKKNRNLTLKPPKIWPSKKIPFAFDESFPYPDRVYDAIEIFHSVTEIEFIERTSEKDYLFFTQGDMHCYSYVGQRGGQQPIYLTRNCDTNAIVHEISHSLGRLHEQNREDRDEYVHILWDNIPDEHHAQFKKLTNKFLKVENRPFDYFSIMLYPSTSFSQYPGEPSITHEDGSLLYRQQHPLSAEDVARFKILYP